MNKAFIFDLDGVIIDDEKIWEEEKKVFYPELLGEEVFLKLGSTIGLRLDEIYKRAIDCGSTISKKDFFESFYKRAVNIYQTAPITSGLQNLVEKLVKLDYKIGIVSSSSTEWINLVLKRTPYLEKNLFVIVSLLDRPELKSKPEPDGYFEAIKEL
jgi:beta-phosphoglucomutase-like phosphatase (HAD superfamily)